MTSGGNNFNHFAENQLTKFSARDAGDFSDAAGEQEMAPKCGSLPRDAGDLVGLFQTVSGRCPDGSGLFQTVPDGQDFLIGTTPVLASVLLIQ